MCCKIGPQHQCIIPDMQGSSSVDRGLYFPLPRTLCSPLVSSLDPAIVLDSCDEDGAGDVWMFDSSLAPKVSRDVDQLVDR